MPIPLIAELITKNNQPFALMDDGVIRGGFHCVETLSERNAISVDRRKSGMLVFVQETNTIYRLQIDLITWTKDSGNNNGIIDIELSGTFSTLSCLHIINGVGHPITSLDTNIFTCDGVLLESGNVGDIRSIAITHGNIFTSPLSIPGSDGDMLYLSQFGNLSGSIPSNDSGDVWLYQIAKRIAVNQFKFSPSIPIKL